MMNLQSEISPELWEAVSKSYEARHYSNTITDAVHYLSELIREKAGVDGDGSSLIGQAFGGDNPKLQINRLQTESEKNEQKGFQELLRGIYTGIRNPRSHGNKTDSPQTTDTIILFIDYLINVINQAKLPFTIEEWTERVFEPYFVQSKEYAVALVSEIPPGKRLDTLITVYQKRNNKKRSELKLIFQVLVERLEDAQKKEFLKIVSRVLRSTEDREDIITHLAILWPEAWKDLDTVVKMRLEHRVICSIKEGKLVVDYTSGGIKKLCIAGELGSWAEPYLRYFLREEEALGSVYYKLRNSSWEERNYFIEYFMTTIPKSDSDNCEYFQMQFSKTFSTAMMESDPEEFFYKTVLDKFWYIPEKYTQQIIKRLEEAGQTSYVILLRDAIPF